MMGPSRRSSVMPCMCFLELPVSSRIMPTARSPALWPSMNTRVVRARSRQQGIALGLTRIGVHAGPAIVGNFGGERFFDYTAYGDTINVAARLEAANKQLGTRICVSATLAARVEDFRGRPVGDLVLRGRTEALRAFEPLSRGQFSSSTTTSYLEAFGKLESGHPTAIASFAAHVGKQSNDQLASFHLKRLLNGQTGSRILMD